MDQLFLHPESAAGKLFLMLCAIVLFGLVIGLVLWLAGKVGHRRSGFTALLFLAPVLLGVVFALVYPAIVTLINSFKDDKSANWVGLSNFAAVVSKAEFRQSIGNTVLWVILVPTLATGIGLVYAVLVDRAKVEKFAKTLIFLPMAISMVGASVIWKFVYNDRVGLLTKLYMTVAGWFKEEVTVPHWLLDAPWNTFFLMVVMIWIQAGFAMTVLSASIKAIPDDVVEAARLDGVSGWRMFWLVTVPMIRPSVVVVMTTVAMTALKAFDIVRTMGGEQFHASVVANDFYIQSFRYQNAGMGAALAVLLFIVVIPVIVYNVHNLKKAEEIR